VVRANRWREIQGSGGEGAERDPAKHGCSCGDKVRTEKYWFASYLPPVAEPATIVEMGFFRLTLASPYTSEVPTVPSKNFVKKSKSFVVSGVE
jgi:hypothetical protein